MRRGSYELWYALVVVLVITVGYIFYTVVSQVPPESGSLFGHLLGVAGFILMLMTETLYSLRKRNRRAAGWGKADSWLRFHIFTGIVGPYMVLLHSAWRFGGLAGAVTLMMVLIVGSGFIGRYIYTLVPRTAAGVELGSTEMEEYISSAESRLKEWMEGNSALIEHLPKDLVNMPYLSPNPWALFIGRIFQDISFNWRWWRETRGISNRQLKVLKELLDMRREMSYQIAAMIMARRILALWHAIHVPLGIALFTTAFIHIGATLYYVTLAK